MSGLGGFAPGGICGCQSASQGNPQAFQMQAMMLLSQMMQKSVMEKASTNGRPKKK